MGGGAIANRDDILHDMIVGINSESRSLPSLPCEVLTDW